MLILMLLIEIFEQLGIEDIYYSMLNDEAFINFMTILSMPALPFGIWGIIKGIKRAKRIRAENAWIEWYEEQRKISEMTVGERAIYEELKELNNSAHHSEWIIIG